MLIDLKSMLNKLTTPRSGFTMVKLTTASNVGLYVRDLATESKVIKISKDSYVFHVQPNDIILQGQYARGRKIHVVEDLDELNDGYKLTQLDAVGYFNPIVDAPSGYRRKHTDESLGNITRALLGLINDTDFSNLKGITFHPLTDVKFTVVKTIEDFKAIAAKRSVMTELKAVPDITSAGVMLHVNHNTGCAEFVIYSVEPINTILLCRGLSVSIDKRVQFLIDTELFPLGTAVLDQATKPYKREEESINVTKDAESVKLD